MRDSKRVVFITIFAKFSSSEVRMSIFNAFWQNILPCTLHRSQLRLLEASTLEPETLKHYLCSNCGMFQSMIYRGLNGRNKSFCDGSGVGDIK